MQLGCRAFSSKVQRVRRDRKIVCLKTHTRKGIIYRELEM